MAPARIIADSDDSEDDFDRGNSPAKPPTPRKSGEGRSSDPISVATGSTDPLTFQKIYDEQRNPATNEIVSQANPTSVLNVETSSSVPVGVEVSIKDDDTNTSSLTSVIDPTMGSNRAKRATKPEVVDLTQVTIPAGNANSTPKDMWDVPSSPVEQPTAPIASLSKTKDKTPGSNKRKRVNNVEFTTPLAMEMPSQGSTQPFDFTPIERVNFSAQEAKRPRLDDPASSAVTADDVDMVVTRDDDSFLVDAPVSGQKPVSLYIEPRTLSASQQLQYEYHSVDPSSDEQRPAASRHLTTQQAAARSSGATTIAYSTPSQTRVMGFRESYRENDEAIPTFQLPQEIQADSIGPEATVEIQSSPDIISAASARRKRSKPDEDPAPISDPHPTDDWNSDDVAFSREMYKPRPSRRRGSDSSRQSDAEKVKSTEIAGAETEPAPDLLVEEAHAANVSKPKRRGRPRKADAAPTSGPIEPVALTIPVGNEVAASLHEPELGTAATEQIKKKRGRPKKADKAASVQQEPMELRAVAEATNPAMVDSKTCSDHQQDEVEKLAGDKKNNKKKRSPEEVFEKAATTSEVKNEVRTLQPTTPNTVSRLGFDESGPQSAATVRETAAAKATPQKVEEKKEVVGKADGKLSSSTPSSHAGKPLYRVGLSKKSRIAPLLKIVRK